MSDDKQIGDAVASVFDSATLSLECMLTTGIGLLMK